MRLKALVHLFALLLFAISLGAPAATAQQTQHQDSDMTELWERYPLDAPAVGPGPVGAREEDGSTAVPRADVADPPGVFALSLLFLALGLAVVGIAGGVYHGASWLVARRERSLRSGSVAASRAKNHQA
jgi:hypothetical protein